MTIFEEAVQFAVSAHQGTYRKRQSIPYIIHPLEVAVIAATITSDEEVLAAAVLHDTVEDTAVTMEEIKTYFGDRVAALVASETENKRPELPKTETWIIRKQESLEELRKSDDTGVKILWLSDKLANMRAFYQGWRIRGNRIWASFNQKDPGLQAWYYRTVGELTRELENVDAWREYHQLVETIFGRTDDDE